MEKLNLTKCKTNKEVCKLVSDRVNSIPYKELIEEVEKRFVFQTSAAKAIYTGLSENINVFLSGPGGYGKSSLIKYILDFYGIPYSIVVGYKDMPVDALLGIPNMDKLLKESKYEINFSDSIFCKPGILIGEEFTDILPATAAALKDILIERGMHGKEGKVESLVSCMIIAANKSAKEIVDDESKRAFYFERFPIQVPVKWEQHSARDYFKLLDLAFPEADSEMLFFISKLLEDNHITFGNTISPRIACEITGVYLSKGINFIDHFPINMSNITTLEILAKKEFNTQSMTKVLKDISFLICSIKASKDHKLAALYALNKLSELRVKDEVLVIVLEAKKRIEDQILAKPYEDYYLKGIDDLFSLISK